MDYDAILDEGLSELPEVGEEVERLDIPDPEGETDGAFTRLTNLPAIADAVGREPAHLHRAIQREFGTNGQWDGSQARYNGSFSVADFQAAIANYVEEYVTCSECGRPDTRLTTEDGTQMLRCEACGAFRPVTKRTTAPAHRNRPTLEEGKTYTVDITGTGRKGDGVANVEEYTVFVPGAAEGQTVEVYIESISGNLAFARLA
jgi:translation initiation factor 2 subunit 2